MQAPEQIHPPRQPLSIRPHSRSIGQRLLKGHGRRALRSGINSFYDWTVASDRRFARMRRSPSEACLVVSPL